MPPWIQTWSWTLSVGCIRARRAAGSRARARSRNASSTAQGRRALARICSQGRLCSMARRMRGCSVPVTFLPMSSSSNSFSAGRRPVKLISMSPSGCLLVANRVSGKLDHAPRQVGDAHRAAHVEHEHVAARTHRAGLDDQLRCLGNGHEVTDDVRMRHRDRARLRESARGTAARPNRRTRARCRSAPCRSACRDCAAADPAAPSRRHAWCSP